MNTKIIGVVAALILLLGAGGAYFLSQNKPVTKTTDSLTPTKTEDKSSSLLDLLSLGKNQQCTFAATNENGSTKGTAYVSGSNARTDITTTVDGKESEISMIRKGNDNYIWGSDLKQGIKMTLSPEELSTNKQVGQYTGSVNPNDKVNFNCTPWSVDESLFTPPADIKFTDMSSLMMPKTTGTTTNTAVCDAIEDAAAKASCIKALSNQ